MTVRRHTPGSPASQGGRFKAVDRKDAGVNLEPATDVPGNGAEDLLGKLLASIQENSIKNRQRD